MEQLFDEGLPILRVRQVVTINKYKRFDTTPTHSKAKFWREQHSARTSSSLAGQFERAHPSHDNHFVFKRALVFYVDGGARLFTWVLW